tara:strand:+ start:130 stop:618 length:489 start_codon:yes stop_codon:yes gene_type:complete
MFRDYRRVEGFPDYIVSNYGDVYSLKNGKVRELKFGYSNCGYRSVSLCINNKAVRQRVHILVGIAFVGKREGGLTYDHIDRNRINNKADNLRLATRSQQALNRKETKPNKLNEKYISINNGYYEIVVVRNRKRIFRKQMSKNKWTLDDAKKVRDEYLHTYES